MANTYRRNKRKELIVGKWLTVAAIITGGESQRDLVYLLKEVVSITYDLFLKKQQQQKKTGSNQDSGSNDNL